MSAENLPDWETYRVSASSNPIVAQIKADMGPDHYVADPDSELMDLSEEGPARRGVCFTPPEHRSEEVADMVTEVIQNGGGFNSPIVLEPNDLAETFHLDYLHSDLPDRKPQSHRESGYSRNDLRDELVNRTDTRRGQRREALARREQQFVEGELAAVVASPTSKLVVLHCKHPFGYAQKGKLPDGSLFQQAMAAWPVPVGYTAYRVARMIAQFAIGCVWCDDDETLEPSVMLVSCGRSLRLFATCDECREANGQGPDYYKHSDDDSKNGYPAERYR